jgi:hypothetical protein
MDDDKFVLPDAPDVFAIAPDEPLKPAEEPPKDEVDEPPVAADNNDQQFTLGELLGLVGLFAVMLSIASSIARWMGWASSPASLAGVFALLFGFATLAGIFYVAAAENARPIARVALWFLIGGYILCAACAAFLPK